MSAIMPSCRSPQVTGSGRLLEPHRGISAVGADSTPFTREGVTVEVLDTGIDELHAAFSGVELVGRDHGSGRDRGVRAQGPP